ncbi:MAG: DPP IV N-terminal domain-containing protein, partial [Dokdonella sp.]
MSIRPRDCLFRTCLILCGFGVTVAASAMDSTEVQTPKRPLTIERLYSLPSIIGTAPENPTWSADSRRLAFLWNDKGLPFRDIWLTGIDGGKPVQITRMPQLDYPPDPGVDITKLEQRARFESDHGISELVWAPDGRHLIFALHGALYQVLPGKPAQALSAAGVSGSDLGVSAQAHAMAYRSARGLSVADFKGDTISTRALYSPTAKDMRVESYVWSADGKRLAFVEADASRVPTRGIPDYLGDATRLVEVKRPFPGEPSPTRRLGVIATSGGEVAWMDLGDEPLDQIFDVRWSPDSQQLLVDKSDLYIKHRRLLIIDPDNGKSRDLLQESDPNNVTAEWWVDWAPDGKGIYFTSDRDNDYHVYYQALSGGEPKAVTSGDWAVFSASISSAANALFVVSNEANAESRRIHRISLSTGEVSAVTPTKGAHHPTISPDGKMIADLFSDDVTPADLYLQTANAAKPKRLQVTHSPLPEFNAYRWIAPKYVVFHNVNDQTPIHARLTLPPDFDPSKMHP